MKDSQRHRARELVLQALYAGEHSDRVPQEMFAQLAGDADLGADAQRFAAELLDLTIVHQAEADADISALAENWDLERMAAIDRAILRMAIAELRYRPDVPAKVALDEAIELAKEFSTTESSRFVNGILDNILRQLQRT